MLLASWMLDRGCSLGVKLHGFLNYIVRCAVKGEPYTIIGYKGKQVRDNLDACDIASLSSALLLIQDLRRSTILEGVREIAALYWKQLN